MEPSRVQKGDAALLMLAAKLTEAGLVVLQPLCEALPFDLGIYHGRHFYRLQVKRAQKDRQRPGRFSVPLRKTTVNSQGPKTFRYTKAHADFICGVIMETVDVYIFPMGAIEHVATQITLDPEGISQESMAGVNRKVNAETYRNRIRLGSELVGLGGRAS